MKTANCIVTLQKLFFTVFRYTARNNFLVRRAFHRFSYGVLDTV